MAPDKNRIVIGLDDGVVHIRDGTLRTLVRAVQNGRHHINAIGRVSVSRLGHRLVAAGEDGIVHAWDLERGGVLGRWSLRGRQITGCVLSQDGSILVVGDSDGNIYPTSIDI